MYLSDVCARCWALIWRTYVAQAVHDLFRWLWSEDNYGHGWWEEACPSEFGPSWPELLPHIHTSFFPLFAVTPPSGDQSTPATWSKELQDSRTAEPCRSSTPWRATWRRDDERPLLSSTRTKASAPSPHFHGTFLHSSYFCSYFWWTAALCCFSFSDIVVWLCRLGCPGFTTPEYRPSPVDSSVAKSLFFPDEAINRHPRFR